MYNIIVILYYLKGTLPMNHFFAYINRTKYIRRWGLMRNTETETLSEHLYQTAILAHALAVIENEMFGGCVNAEKIAIAALYHDASEIITGDMPTPVKYHNDEIRDAYHKIEDETAEMLLEKLPESLRPAYAPLVTESGLTPEEKKILKAADTLGAYIKCISELGAGNRDFASAEKSTAEKLKRFELRSLDYFMEEFLGSYSLTIDEMK